MLIGYLVVSDGLGLGFVQALRCEQAGERLVSARALSIRKVTVADFVVVVIAAIVFVVEVALLAIFVVGLIASVSVILRGFRVRTNWAARWVPVAGFFARFSLVALGFLFMRIGWDGAESGIFVSFYLAPTTLLLIVVAMTNYARRDRVVA